MKRIIGIILGLFLSTNALAQYLTPAVNSPLFPSTPSAGMSPLASSGSAADWKFLDATINVKTRCGATGNGSTDDTAAINTCIATFNTATNGALYFPAGTYLTSAGLTAVTANGLIKCDGPSNFTGQLVAAVSPATQINNTTTNASVFTINSQNLMIRDCSIKNTAGSTPTTGSAGITVTSGTEYSGKVDIENVQVQGFYIDIDRQAGANWVMHNILVLDPVLYGVKIRNINNVDFGDWTISDSNFNTGPLHSGTDAIRIESSGGGKITNIKVNCNQTSGSCNTNFTNGIDVQGSGLTSDLQISNISIENYTAVGIILNGSWPHITINNVQLFSALGGNCITITNGDAIAISNIVSNGNTPCITVTTSTNISATNIVYGGGNNIPIQGILSSTGTGIGAQTKSINSVWGGNKENVLQGLLTVENNTTSFSSLMNISLGQSFMSGGTPTAAAYFGLIGPANDPLAFTGAAQKDWMESINGGGNWWVQFNNDPNHGGTNTQGLKLTPLSAGGASLLQILSGTSGNTPGGWLQWGGQGRVTSDVPFSSNVLGTVTGLSQSVQASRNYSFDAYLSWTDAAAGGIQCAIAGSATATAIRYDGWIIDSGANGIKGNAAATALGGVVASATTTGTNGVVQIRGTITVANAGTLLVQCAQNTNNGTNTVIKQGSYWLVQDMP